MTAGFRRRIDFTYGNVGKFNATYWDQTGPFTFQMKGTTTPLAAITKGLEESRGTKGECQTAAQSAVLLGAAKALGNGFNAVHGTTLTVDLQNFKESSAVKTHTYMPPWLKPRIDQMDKIQADIKNLFDRMMAGKISRDEGLKEYNRLVTEYEKVFTPLYKLTNDDSNWVPGDAIAFKNSDLYPAIYPAGPWRAENTIYLGKDSGGTPRFAGLGVPSTTYDGVNNRLARELETDMKKVKAYLNNDLAKNPATVARAQAQKITPEAAAQREYDWKKLQIGVVAVLRLQIGL
jgi:hypothetical protein